VLEFVSGCWCRCGVVLVVHGGHLALDDGATGLFCCMRMCQICALSFRVYALVVSVKEVCTQQQPAQNGVLLEPEQS
jgi:hypothetical protein